MSLSTMNPQQAKRTVLFALVFLAAMSTAKTVTGADGKGPRLPGVKVAVGGLIAGAMLTALADPAPGLAAGLAILAAIGGGLNDGTALLDVVHTVTTQPAPLRAAAVGGALAAGAGAALAVPQPATPGQVVGAAGAAINSGAAGAIGLLPGDRITSPPPNIWPYSGQ